MQLSAEGRSTVVCLRWLLCDFYRYNARWMLVLERGSSAARRVAAAVRPTLDDALGSGRQLSEDLEKGIESLRQSPSPP